MVIFPGCKINIGLDVLYRRPDGYHDLDTLMFPVAGLTDAVEVTPAPASALTVVGLEVDCPPEKNLCMKALRLMQREFGAGDAHIALHKVVPSGAGLGGGSADAAAVIMACNEVFALGLTDGRMEGVAAELGSDIPFFIKGVPAMATGRGEVFSPVPAGVVGSLAGKFLLVVKPPVAVGTAEAYGGITPHMPAATLADRLSGGLLTWRDGVGNDFEKHIFALHPILGDIKERLYAMGAVYASMSGSGSALYGLFDTPPESGALPDGLFVFQQAI